MKNIFPVSIISILLISCGGSDQSSHEETNETSSDTTVIDSTLTDTLVVAEPEGKVSIDVEQLLSKAEISFELPLEIDSAFVDELWSEGENEEGDLSNIEAQYLSFDFVDHDIVAMSTYDVETFIRMDSLKIKGEYEDYQNSIDIGMARYANAKVEGKVKIDENMTLLLWSTDYATYEACPYGYGTCLFGTLFVKNVGLNTTILGEISGGGDAPYWGSTLITSSLDASSIHILKVSENGGDEDPETGEELVEHSEEKATFSISADGISK